MKRTHTLAALAAALAFAVPAWAQSTTATDPNGSTMSTGPGVSSSLPGGANTAVAPAIRNEVTTTHLRAECFDTVNKIWRTTGDCAPGTSLPGTRAPGAINGAGSINGAPPSSLSGPNTGLSNSSSAGTTLPAAPAQPGTVR
ncbi:MAG TPA: hypothetical protein VM122_03345 [Usitatibacter sp.]|nr:hypothetical protein [Usitatibacter sp.]